jgi:hypothetical protein
MFELETVERPDHPAARLAAAFARWTETPAGERTGRVTIDVVDSVGIRVCPTGQVVELTERQVSRLAAALAGSDGYVTDSARAIADWMATWGPLPGKQAAATVLITDWRITDDDLDEGIRPYPVRVPVGDHRLADLTGFLTEAADLLLLTRRGLLPFAKWQEGQQLTVGTRAVQRVSGARTTTPYEVDGVLVFGEEGPDLYAWLDAYAPKRKAMPETGYTCVVSEVHIHVPPDGTGKPAFSYLVRLNIGGTGTTLWLEEDQLESIG